MKKFSLLVALISLNLSSIGLGGTWTVDDAHSEARFKVKHLAITNVWGRMTGIKGTVDIDDKDITKSTVNTTLDATSINTDNAKRDEHLRSPDFFDTKKFPTVTFKSKSVVKDGEGKLKVTGDLTMRGVTKEVVLDVDGPTAEVKDPWGNIRRGLTATTKIHRKDFGVSWQKTLDKGGVVVGEDVDIIIDLEVVKK